MRWLLRDGGLFRGRRLSREKRSRLLWSTSIEVQAFQSAGGNAMRQKLGAGCVNSTATLGGPIRSFFTETTRHSRCSPLSEFCIWSLCRGATMSVKSMSAPCALMTSVCVFS